MADKPYAEPKGGTASETPNMAEGEYTAALDDAIELQLSDQLRALRDRLTEAFDGLQVLGFRGELTLVAPPEQLLELLTFCRDDDAVRCEFLMDLSGVHWPGGQRVEHAQETTGWPTYQVGDEVGRLQLDYILYSITHNHRFRVRVNLPDEGATVPSVTSLWRAANVMEREAYDFLGISFTGHPKLERILMPEDWEGHPHRKDYPLGGVEVQYKGATVPPPDQRSY